MWLAVAFSMAVGAAIVLQNGTQAHMMRNANFWLLLVVSNLIVAVMCLATFLAQRERGGVIEELGRMPALVLVPGVCGLVIVAGMPMAIARIGVFPAVMIVIACQIITSLVWDWYGGQAPNLTRVLGAVLVFVGVVLVMRRPE